MDATNDDTIDHISDDESSSDGDDDDDVDDEENLNSGSSEDQLGEKTYRQKSRSSVNAEVREKALGFKPQKEILENVFLPYSDVLDAESTEAFAKIKAGLVRSVCLQDMRVGFSTWSAMLLRYLDMYGLKFSKADHVALVKALLAVLDIPDLEPQAVENAVASLIALLDTPGLLDSGDLVVDWRPLFKLYEFCRYSRLVDHAIVVLPERMHRNLYSLIRLCRQFFPPDSTAQMLDEWLPMLSPYFHSMYKAVDYLELFLPTFNCEDSRATTLDLWIDQLLAFWATINTSFGHDGMFISLFARVAKDNVGCVDWEPYVPIMFSRIQRNLKLPVSYDKNPLPVLSDHEAELKGVKWIVATILPGSSTEKYLAHLIKLVESFCYPANRGQHTSKLVTFMRRLCVSFASRVRRERNPKKSKKPGKVIAEENKLTDAQIENFVRLMRPMAMNLMYSGGGVSGGTQQTVALKCLSSLRPDIMIPPIMEALALSLETVTSPHRFMADMLGISAVCRDLVYSARGYPEGPSQLIPLLIAVLPGIDSNDTGKSALIFHFLNKVCHLVPLVDCSAALQDPVLADSLTEEEKVVCGQTTQFEDFVLQFLDRCFVMVDSSVTPQDAYLAGSAEIHRSRLENFRDAGMATVFYSILCQSSSAIYDAALLKVKNFLVGRVLEPKISGRLAVCLIRGLVKVDASKGLAAFLPTAIEVLRSHASSSPTFQTDEHLDDEFSFNQLIFFECLKFGGTFLKLYIESVKEVLRQTLHVASKEGSSTASFCLMVTLSSLTRMRPKNYGLLNTPSQSSSRPEYMAFKDWGRPCSLQQLRVEWQVPGEDELRIAQEMVDEFVGEELDCFKAYCAGQVSLTNDQLNTRLRVVRSAIMGCSTMLPFKGTDEGFDNRVVRLIDSCIDMNLLPGGVATNPGSINLRGRPCRLVVIEALNELLEKLLKHTEDDTKSLVALIETYDCALVDCGETYLNVHRRRQTVSVFRRTLENPVVGSKSTTRQIHLEKLMLMHELRLAECGNYPLTESHAVVIRNMLRLATSRYSSVRIRAQRSLITYTSQFPHSYYILVPGLLSILDRVSSSVHGHLLDAGQEPCGPIDEDQMQPQILQSAESAPEDNHLVSHEEYKGALYVLLGHKKLSIVVLQNWELLRKVWPKVVGARLSPKESIASLVQNILKRVLHSFVTFSVEFNVPAEVVAKVLEAFPVDPYFSDQEAAEAAVKARQRNATAVKDYESLIDELCDLFDGVDDRQAKELHWKRSNLASTMLLRLIRHDRKLPLRAVKVVLRNLLHDILVIRKTSVTMLCNILLQQKRSHSKIPVPITIGKGSSAFVPGVRPDNEWLCYRSSDLPVTESDWDSPSYVHKGFIGYFGWPKVVQVYAPYQDQPPVLRDPSEMNPVEAAIFNFFTSGEEDLLDKAQLKGGQGPEEGPVDCKTNLERLLKFVSTEENHGKDKFSSSRFFMFKGLFRNYGPPMLRVLEPHIKRLAESTTESANRCAAELLTAASRGSKHWSFQDSKDLQEQLIVPVLDMSLAKVSSATFVDWGTSLATCADKRDPRRMHWMIEALMKDPITSKGSLVDCSRLFVLQGVLDQAGWKLGQAYWRLLTYLDPHLSHPYRNVRERLGSVLANLFLYDVDYRSPLKAPPGSDHVSDVNLRGPKCADFVGRVVLGMTKLLNESEEPEIVEGDRKKSHDEGTRLLHTMARFITCLTIRSLDGPKPVFYDLLPALFTHSNSGQDPNLAKDCSIALAYLARPVISSGAIPNCMTNLESALTSSSPRAKVAALNFMEVVVFHNLPLFLSDKEQRPKILLMVQRALSDDRVDVRGSAYKTLSGFLHSGFFDESTEQDLLNGFKAGLKKSGKALAKLKRAKDRGAGENDQARWTKERHTAVLGLCSFVVAHPYDVPGFMPDLLVSLADCVHESLPVSASVKQAFQSFKRTHQDNWLEHKAKFTSDQLEVLTDVLISPSYYA